MGGDTAGTALSRRSEISPRRAAKRGEPIVVPVPCGASAQP